MKQTKMWLVRGSKAFWVCANKPHKRPDGQWSLDTRPQYLICESEAPSLFPASLLLEPGGGPVELEITVRAVD